MTNTGTLGRSIAVPSPCEPVTEDVMLAVETKVTLVIAVECLCNLELPSGGECGLPTVGEVQSAAFAPRSLVKLGSGL